VERLAGAGRRIAEPEDLRRGADLERADPEDPPLLDFLRACGMERFSSS
jgi:hypothetical protein